MEKKVKKGFKSFLTRFPKVQLPLTLNEVALREFDKNKPLRHELYHEFCQTENEVEDDEFTEYVACIRLPDTEFYGLVVWKASLLEYKYILLTFDKSGELLNKNVIGGTKLIKDSFITVVATFKNSWNIETNATVEQNRALPQNLSSPQRLSISKSGEISVPESFNKIWD